MIIFDKLYSIDSASKVRVYYIEQDGDKYRMVSGIENGKEVRSKWTIANPKNIGKSNETTGESQASLEVKAAYIKKQKEGYFDDREEAINNPQGKFFEPMLAHVWEKTNAKYKKFPLIADPKLDGMRLTVFHDEKISRKGEDVPTAIHIVNELKSFFTKFPNIRLDGELYNHDYKEDFNTLMSIARKTKPTEEDLKIASEKLEFHVYDCYDYNNTNISALDRKRWIKQNIQDFEHIKIVSYAIIYNQQELEEIKEKNLIDGYEGTITRGIDSLYENKRSSYLLKHKDFITEEFKVVSILAGKGNRSGIAGTIEVDFNGKIVRCSLRGSFEYAFNLLKDKDQYEGGIATVRHFGETPDGSLRFPVCIDFNRPD